MTRTRTMVLAVVSGLVLTSVAGCGSSSPDPLSVPASIAPGSDDPALIWFDTTAAAVTALDAPVQSPMSALWATAWLAGDRALVGMAALDDDLAAVAFGQAVGDTLVSEVPAVAGLVDKELARTLDAVPEGPDRDDAVRTGAEAAAGVIAERADDGLTEADVDTPYELHGGAGFWVPTSPGRPPNQVSLGGATPFLTGPDLPTAPPPPPLGSSVYRADLAELHDLGAKTGSARTDEQTEVALFWAQSSLSAYSQVLRELLVQRAGTPLSERVHLVAVFHQVTTDAQIACFAAKYDYEHWRPLTAIHEADLDGRPVSDGDPLTTPDPSWEPLITTPSHPEYPSAHTVYAGAAAGVLDRLVGPPSDPVRLTSSTAPGVTRDYTDWSQLVDENVDARVFEGVHFRTSDVNGAVLGSEVARLALERLAP